MTLYHLTQTPHLIGRLKEERQRTYNQETNVSADTLQKMDYLHAVFKEVLRFEPPAPLIFDRVALVDHKLDDLVIRKGDIVSPSFLSQFFDEKHFESPHEFDPERWLNNSRKIDSFAYTPFSALLLLF